MKPILEMRGITKRFPGVIANDNVNLTIYPGEVHALLGENGAGKSTLMNILSGIYSPNDGYIYINGKLSWIDGPKSAIAQGIGMVHQHFKLIEPLTVAENIYLAVGKRCPFLLNKKKMEEEIRRCSEEYHLPVDPSAKINQLSVGEQQRVEIVKQLYCGANILVLDEPTAVLTPQETEQLFATLRKMTEQGKAVVFITHKLFEVMEYSDRITVLRSGKSIGTMLTKETNQDELVRLMVGRSVEKMTREEDAPAVPGGSILELKQVEALGDRKTPVLRGIDLEVKAGEIFGIAGVAGNGQKELCEVIAGLRQVTAGTVMMNGQDVTKEIRLPEVSMYASAVSAHPAVRAYLLEMQRELARTNNVIMDGRDIGTVVLPDAQVKVFLTASPEARARRRMLELEQRGIPQPFEQILTDIQERDWNDSHRAAAPLRQAEDAVLLDTTELTFQESEAALLHIIRERTEA